MTVRILGLDPGIGRTGWGVIEKKGSVVTALAYDCLETSSSLAVEKRLEEIYTQLSLIIDTYKPEYIAIEELFFNTNVKTAFAVGQARGVMYLLASQKQLPITSYTPPQVKMAVAGYGKAPKEQVGKMVKQIYKLSKIPTPDDTADALAIAATHAFSLNRLLLMKRK